MANILEGIVKIRAEGVQQATTQVSSAVQKTEASFKKMAGSSNQATNALSNLSRVAQDAPYGFIGIANNINPLLESFQRLKATTGTTGGALRAMGSALTGPAGIGLAIGVVSSLLVTFGDKLFGAGNKASSAKTELKDFQDAVKGVLTEQAKEIVQVSGFISVLKNETETRERKLQAVKELQKIQPEVFAGLKLEGDSIRGLDVAYKNYISNISTVIEAKIKQVRLEQITARILELEGKTLTSGQRNVTIEYIRQLQLKKDQGKLNEIEAAIWNEVVDLDNERSRLLREQKALFEDMVGLSKGIKLTVDKPGKKDPFSEWLDAWVREIAGAKLEIPISPEFTIDFNEVKFVMLGGDVKTFKEQVQENINKGIEKLVVSPRFNFSPEVVANRENQARMIAAGNELGNSFRSAFENAIQQSFEGIGEMLGNVFAGKNPGQSILNAFSGLLSALGQALIKYGIIKEGLDKILGPGGIAIPGALAVGLGVAAIAASSLLKNFGGGRAAGGPVQAGRSFLVGEKGPEIFTPGMSGNIIPNGRMGSFAGGGGIGGRVVFEISGNKLIGVLANGNRSQASLI